MKGVAILKSAFSELNDYVNFLSIFIIKLTVNNKNILLCWNWLWKIILTSDSMSLRINLMTTISTMTGLII